MNIYHHLLRRQAQSRYKQNSPPPSFFYFLSLSCTFLSSVLFILCHLSSTQHSHLRFILSIRSTFMYVCTVCHLFTTLTVLVVISCSSLLQVVYFHFLFDCSGSIYSFIVTFTSAYCVPPYSCLLVQLHLFIPCALPLLRWWFPLFVSVCNFCPLFSIFPTTTSLWPWMLFIFPLSIPICFFILHWCCVLLVRMLFLFSQCCSFMGLINFHMSVQLIMHLIHFITK